MTRYLSLVLLLAVAACGTTYAVPDPGQGDALPSSAASAPVGPVRDRADFSRVVSRVEPAAEAICREEAPNASSGYCDLRIVLDTNPDSPANAYQTRGKDGRPVIVVTSTLLRQMQSDDEIAFVVSHEAAHHIARHLEFQARNQMVTAAAVGGLVAVLGGPDISQDVVDNAMQAGAYVGGRAYSQKYELEADWLGAFITARAGYDPERGAQIFSRPALSSSGGPVLLATHPASPQRQGLISTAAQEIRRQQAAGLVPRPSYANS